MPSPLVNCTEWLEEDISTGDDDEVTCTRAKETDRCHYITLLHVSTDSTTAGAAGSIRAILKFGGTAVLTMWPAEADGNMPMLYSPPFPIKVPVNTAVTFESEMTVYTDDRVAFTMGGFTR